MGSATAFIVQRAVDGWLFREDIIGSPAVVTTCPNSSPSHHVAKFISVPAGSSSTMAHLWNEPAVSTGRATGQTLHTIPESSTTNTANTLRPTRPIFMVMLFGL